MWSLGLALDGRWFLNSCKVMLQMIANGERRNNGQSEYRVSKAEQRPIFWSIPRTQIVEQFAHLLGFILNILRRSSGRSHEGRKLHDERIAAREGFAQASSLSCCTHGLHVTTADVRRPDGASWRAAVIVFVALHIRPLIWVVLVVSAWQHIILVITDVKHYETIEAVVPCRKVCSVILSYVKGWVKKHNNQFYINIIRI